MVSLETTLRNLKESKAFRCFVLRIRQFARMLLSLEEPESRRQKAEGRKQKAESRRQKAESRRQ
jgi:hypothetical protein